MTNVLHMKRTKVKMVSDVIKAISFTSGIPSIISTKHHDKTSLFYSETKSTVAQTAEIQSNADKNTLCINNMHYILILAKECVLTFIL